LRTEAIDLAKIDPAQQRVFQEKAGLFHADQREGAVGFYLHGKVHITVRAVVTAGNGTEHGQVTYSETTKTRLLGREASSYSLKSAPWHSRPHPQTIDCFNLRRQRVPLSQIQLHRQMRNVRFGAKHNDIQRHLGDIIRWNLGLPKRKALVKLHDELFQTNEKNKVKASDLIEADV
jgi:hypothetical protein